MVACKGGGNEIPDGTYSLNEDFVTYLIFSGSNVKVRWNVMGAGSVGYNGTYEIISDGDKNYIHFYWNDGGHVKENKGVFIRKGKILTLSMNPGSSFPNGRGKYTRGKDY